MFNGGKGFNPMSMMGNMMGNMAVKVGETNGYDSQMFGK